MLQENRARNPPSPHRSYSKPRPTISPMLSAREVNKLLRTPIDNPTSFATAPRSTLEGRQPEASQPHILLSGCGGGGTRGARLSRAPLI